METKTALLVVYNHRYDKNIERIEALYAGKFSHVYHLMPFYDGTVPNVIPVYASSFQFQSYISQAYTHLKNQGFTHYFIVSDDMLLNPIINEQNLWDTLQLDKDSCMLPGIIELQQYTNKWNRIADAVEYRKLVPGVEVSNILPTYEDACQRFRNHGISTETLTPDVYQHIWKYSRRRKFLGLKLWRRKKLPAQLQLDYPLCAGYSDIFLVTADCMQNFCTYCGAFAAQNLFVEVAIPTAMVLAAGKIAVSSDTNRKGIHKILALKNGDMWPAGDQTLQNTIAPFNHSLQTLIENFPEDRLFLHPIKLSQWK